MPTTVAITPVDGGTHLTITTRFADAAGLAAAAESGMDTGLAETLDELHTHLEEQP